MKIGKLTSTYDHRYIPSLPPKTCHSVCQSSSSSGQHTRENTEILQAVFMCYVTVNFEEELQYLEK